jgi:sorbitol-specific phosphotransferase system component IIC
MKDLLKKISQALASVGLIFVGAILCAWGGQEKKWFRRFIFPAIVTIYAYFLLQNWWVLTIYLMAVPLSIGYGLVSPDDDKPSFLGKIAYKLFPKSQLWQNVFCRGMVGILISLTILSVPILKSDWLSFIVGSVLIIGVWASISWKDFGEMEVKLFEKTVKLLKVDLSCYAVTTLGIVTIIHGFFG